MIIGPYVQLESITYRRTAPQDPNIEPIIRGRFLNLSKRERELLEIVDYCAYWGKMKNSCGGPIVDLFNQMS